MTAQFLATQKVRHIGVWTATNYKDKPPKGMPVGWTFGRYRALCGQGIRSDILIIDNHDLEAAYAGVLSEHWPRRIVAAMRRPVCRRCLATLGDIHELLGGDE